MIKYDGRRFRAVPADIEEHVPNEESARRSQACDLLQVGGRLYALVDLEDEKACDLAADLGKLTGRELQIAHKIGAGKGDKIIAFELGISQYTVREHVRRIFYKLKVSKRASVVRALYAASAVSD